MEQILNSLSISPIQVVDADIPLEQYTAISISSENKALKEFDVASSIEWSSYLDQYLEEKQAKVAYGGYLEKRDIYKRSNYFNTTEATEERNIHLGIDLWCNEGTKVLAALDGTIHSFQNNKNHGDYGPTIILEHHLENITFYTLYGHLSLNSLDNIAVGQEVKKSEVIGFLGDNSVNGDYAPHLHFQLILDLQGNSGDYPGVCSEKNINLYKKNCPNPNLLLKLPHEI
ncbi:peptidoglycan DD-metalloendopeptidase family protein [Tenacibaculum agarivorans]|uniref:peptidoglycan DD-metalloendopeptidase family protein n=1 Tax=Tenacibaculum agarivorans TaxID=1908389 RepID=UPI00094BA867|nr:peptidoglycan DD-metalloendopeptidase family protein [Tenacibaculum agarivorans]